MEDATIDTEAKGSLTVFKFDLTNAEKDGAWDSSYVSTGVYDEDVNKALGQAVRDGDSDNTSDLGNGQTSYGYAIAGVEFTYVRIADIIQFSESTADNRTDKGKSVGGYAQYIATREGVEMIDDSHRHDPATDRQKKLIQKILKDFPDAKGSHEYMDFKQQTFFPEVRDSLSASLRRSSSTAGLS